jgi:GT2 family glycosyltransferase
MLRLIADDEPGNRRRLYAARRSPGYEQAWTDPEPLVSVVIATYSSWETLRDRAIPSVLGQTYPHLELIVVGDAAPPETAGVIEAIDDERVRYVNRNRNGPYPSDPLERWYVVGTPPFNEGTQLARGAWIAPMADDDALRPDCLETLLERAREGRHEVEYSMLHCLMNDGTSFDLGEFPPRLGHFGFQGSIYHSALRCFEFELGDSLFATPNDWGLCRRMLRAGVRFGMVDRPLVDHWESKFHPSWE